MPLPSPQPRENREDFISRCAGDPQMNKDFDDPKQRVAVCSQIWRDAKAAAPVQVLLTGASEKLELEAQAAGVDGEGKPRLRRFRMTGYTGVPMKLEGFFHPLLVDLEGLRVPRQEMPVFRRHDDNQIVGHTDTVEVSEQRLKVAGVISGVGPAAQEVRDLADRGFPWQASLGASLERREFVDRGETVQVNGRNWQGPLFVARATTLQEISFVPIGADTATSANVAATGELAMNFDAWLATVGFDGATLNDSQRTALTAAYQARQAPVAVPVPTPPAPAPVPPTVTATQDLEALIAAQRREEQRRIKIRDRLQEAMTVEGLPADEAETIGKAALTGQWDENRFEVEIIRALRFRGHGIAFPKRHAELPEAEVLEAAVCQFGKLDEDKLIAAYGEPTLQAARRRWKDGLSLSELLMTFARRNGHEGMSLRGNLEGTLRAAFAAERPDLRASGSWGPSTGGGLSGILSNVANKFLAAGFNAIDTSWRQIAAIRSVSDFKQISTYSLTGGMTYEPLPPGGEIKHGLLGEEIYVNKVDTYARMLGIDRRDLINDDMGAFTQVGRKFGRGAALSFNRLFWSVYLNNGAFFTAGRGNLLTGTTSALSVAGLDNAYRTFMNQKDPDGETLGTTPTILLVPPALAATAWQLMRSELLNQQPTGGAAVGSTNVWAGMFTVVVAPYLQNTAYTGSSATAWYLLANPNDLAVIEAAFLNGKDTPTVESAEADFNMLGVAWRGFWDYGVALQEYRSAVKSTGVA